jgi:hypothetical protein
MREAMVVGDRLHPRHLVDLLARCRVHLREDRLDDAARRGVGEVVRDSIVAANGLIGAEDARHLRALQPRRLAQAPDVVVSIDDGIDHGVRSATCQARP